MRIHTRKADVLHFNSNKSYLVPRHDNKSSMGNCFILQPFEYIRMEVHNLKTNQNT